MFDRPTLYFRRKENGAAVFRISETQHSRLDLQQIAMLKPNGDIKVHNKQEVTDTERAEINAWDRNRKQGRATLETAKIDILIGQLNATAQWLQTDAEPADVRDIAEPLLMAMHDLRSSLVRSMAGK